MTVCNETVFIRDAGFGSVLGSAVDSGSGCGQAYSQIDKYASRPVSELDVSSWEVGPL